MFLSAFLSPANKTTIVVLLMTALLSLSVMSSTHVPVSVSAGDQTVMLMKADGLQIFMGVLAVVAAGAAIVALSAVVGPLSVPIVCGFVGAYASGIGGALTIWDGFGRPGRMW